MRTSYFAEDDVERLRAILQELWTDALERGDHLPESAQMAMQFRLTALEAAIELLGERVAD